MIQLSIWISNNCPAKYKTPGICRALSKNIMSLPEGPTACQAQQNIMSIPKDPTAYQKEQRKVVQEAAEEYCAELYAETIMPSLLRRLKELEKSYSLPMVKRTAEIQKVYGEVIESYLEGVLPVTYSVSVYRNVIIIHW